MVPFNRPTTAERSAEYLQQALASGHLAGDGSFTQRCQERLRAATGSDGVLLTTSCTHALEMAAILLDLGPGDEVVMPSFNFPSAANAVVLRGARPVFVDIRPDTLNLDETLLEAAITERTRAIVVVHYAGVATEMKVVTEIATQRGIAVVEDIAHSLFGDYDGRPTGGLGTLAAASFHETKNLTCGEGGALFVNDPELLERAEIVREKGTNRSQFHRGEVSKYSWVDVGSSYLPSEVLAALLFAQLEDVERIQAARARVWRTYYEALAGWAAEVGAELPTIPSTCASSHHMFHLLLPTGAMRDELLAHLRARGVLAVFHYLPLHLSAMGRGLGGRPGELPVTESTSARLARLPFFTDISDSELELVIDAVLDFR